MDLKVGRNKVNKDKHWNKDTFGGKKRVNNKKTGSDPGVEGYPAWAALPLVFSFLRLSQIFRVDASAWFGSAQPISQKSAERKQMDRDAKAQRHTNTK